MATKKKSFARVVSPKGKAMYPFLSKPDTKFDSDGVYRLNLVVGGDSGEAFVDQLREYHDKYYDEFCEKEGNALNKANLPIKPHLDGDGQETGEYEVKFKLKAVGKSKDKTWEQRPVVYDASNNVINTSSLEGLNMGNGSECRVAFEIIPYNTGMAGMGISLRMKSVQIINLVEYRGGHNDFETEEGFTVEQGVGEASDF